ncbi:hypothetical protein CO678_41140 [Bradyrhizobium diazoefficiens]|nr:hypothetical protein CO678_41140 [Bradyrhizobium diazoefficiens]
MVDQVEAALATSDERPTSGRSGARARVGHNVDDVMACVIVAADLCARSACRTPAGADQLGAPRRADAKSREVDRQR